MPAPTFNGDNLTISLDVIGDWDAGVDLYKAWKTWAKEGQNSKFPQAFDTTGGDPTTATEKISGFYFLRNDLGWRIKPAEADGETVIAGDLFPRLSTRAMFIPTTGAFTAVVRQIVSSKSITTTVVSGSGLSASEQDMLQFIYRINRNRWRLNKTTGKLEMWNDAGTALLTTWPLSDFDGNVYDGTFSPEERGVPTDI